MPRLALAMRNHSILRVNCFASWRGAFPGVARRYSCRVNLGGSLSVPSRKSAGNRLSGMSNQEHFKVVPHFPRIVYVEAHPDMRYLMAVFLESAGYICVGAASNAEAVECLEYAVQEFHLVIASHQPPNVDGLTLAQELRAKMFRGSIMIYSLTVDESDEKDCKQFGVDAVLRNPTAGKLFLQKVAALCRQ